MSQFMTEMIRARRGGELPRLPLGRGAMPGEEWQRAVAQHLRSYSAEAFRDGFVELLEWAALRASRDTPLLGGGADAESRPLVTATST